MGGEYKRFMFSSGDSFMIILNQKFAMQIRQQRGKAEQREVYNFEILKLYIFMASPNYRLQGRTELMRTVPLSTQRFLILQFSKSGR